MSTEDNEIKLPLQVHCYHDTIEVVEEVKRNLHIFYLFIYNCMWCFSTTRLLPLEMPNHSKLKSLISMFFVCFFTVSPQLQLIVFRF